MLIIRILLNDLCEMKGDADISDPKEPAGKCAVFRQVLFLSHYFPFMTSVRRMRGIESMTVSEEQFISLIPSLQQ